MVSVLVLIFLGCIAVTKEIEMCDRVKLSLNNQKAINFTKQSFEKNGQPVYYSAGGTFEHVDIEAMIWWNNETNTWISQIRPYSNNKITKTIHFSLNKERLNEQ